MKAVYVGGVVASYGNTIGGKRVRQINLQIF